MLAHWFSTAAKGGFREAQSQTWSLPSISPPVFAALVEHLLLPHGSTAWSPPLEHVLEIAVAGLYLDLPRAVDACLDLVTPHILDIDEFGGLPAAMIRALIRRTDVVGLVHAEALIRSDPDLRGRHDAHVRSAWLDHLARIPEYDLWRYTSTAFTDAGEASEAAAAVVSSSTSSLRRRVLAHTPLPPRNPDVFGAATRDRDIEAVQLPKTVTDDDLRWIARWAKRGARKLHLRLTRSVWPPPLVTPFLSSGKAAHSRAAKPASTEPVDESGAAETKSESVPAAEQSLVHLVAGEDVVWQVSSASSFATLPIVELTLDSVPSLDLHALFNWVRDHGAGVRRLAIHRLAIHRSLATLSALATAVAGCPATVAELDLAENLAASQQPPSGDPRRDTNRLLRDVRGLGHTALRLAGNGLLPVTLLALLAALPSSSTTALLLDGLHLGPILDPAATFTVPWPNLARVDVANNGLVARTLVELITALAECGGNSIRRLELGGNHVTSAVVAALAASLPRFPVLRQLGLDGQGGAEAPAAPAVAVDAWVELFEAMAAVPMVTASGWTLGLRRHAAFASTTVNSALETLEALYHNP
ncbi:hypothetical protein H9P43_001408 [Blastocladiella emersonii ATCC 22665]|nr:hypothetical protein H9P43_001408 [Blastocladiella emersonii ATCC 22665]